jgi:hypothetical protein
MRNLDPYDDEGSYKPDEKQWKPGYQVLQKWVFNGS